MKLFDEKSREYKGLKRRTDNDYSYLNNSARLEAERVRNFLEYWVQQLPEKEADEIISRIKSKSKSNYDSATFELILFAIFKKLGCDVVFHPELENKTNKHLDFLVRPPSGEKFYLEAVLASEKSGDEANAEKRKKVVLEEIESKLDSPNFYLGISDLKGAPKKQPSTKRIVSDLKTWLDSLDPDTFKLDDRGASKEMNLEGWTIEFDAIPVKPEFRDDKGRTIGIESFRLASAKDAIKNKIKKKGNKFGKLGKPLVIAINVDSPSLLELEEFQALFGEIQPISKTQKSYSSGALIHNGKPKYKRISGVWFFKNLNPWNLVTRRNTLYVNPFSNYKVPELFELFSNAHLFTNLHSTPNCNSRINS